MKNMFKLAAVAVSMALAMGLVACSDSVDDIEDASKPKYLLTAQIDSYVDSLDFEQNVTDKEIKSLKEAHADMMTILGDCEDCLAAYFEMLKNKIMKNKINRYYLNSSKADSITRCLKAMKTKFKDEKTYHKAFVYKDAIKKHIDVLEEAEDDVKNIEDIAKDGLNSRQSGNMSAYLDAAAALKAALSKEDADTCKTKIDAADTAIKDFNTLVENKKVSKADITTVTAAVEAMKDDIRTNVVEKIDSEIPMN